MPERILCRVAVVAALLLAAATAPAQARTGAPEFGAVRRLPPAALQRPFEAPRLARPIGRRNELLHRRDLDRRTIAVWPYPWYPDTAPTQPAAEQHAPPVIVLSNAASDPPSPAAPATLPDYSYVPGCHAIPNGYHCDIPRKAPPPP